MLIDHVDLTVPSGTLNDAFCADLDLLLTDILGWPGESRTVASPLDGSPRYERVYLLPNKQFVVLREADDYLQCGFEDHIGVMVEPSELDRIFRQCQELSARDHRVTLGWTVDELPIAVDIGPVVIRGFFVRFLMPLWLDVQTREAVR